MTTAEALIRGRFSSLPRHDNVTPGRPRDDALARVEDDDVILNAPADRPEAGPFRGDPLPWLARLHQGSEPDDDWIGARGQLSESAEKEGLDVLGWYESPRGSRRWGIYLRELGIDAMATGLGPDTKRYDRDDLVRVAAKLIYHHEYFHFLIDVAGGGIERITDAEVWLPYHTAASRSARGYDPLEEALANENALRVGVPFALRRRAERVLGRAPEGYRDFARYATPDARTRGIRSLLGSMASLGRSTRSVELLELLVDSSELVVGPVDVPTYLVRDRASTLTLGLITALSVLTESKPFQRDLRKVPPEVRLHWAVIKEQVMSDVRPPELHFKKLSNPARSYSVRVGRDYRAVFEMNQDGWVASRLRHRREVYQP